jgi:hypothetical protein
VIDMFNLVKYLYIIESTYLQRDVKSIMLIMLSHS